MITKKTKIFLTGHNGLVGSSILKKLKEKGYKNILFENKKELNLLDENKVNQFLKKKNQKLLFMQQQKLGVYLKIVFILQILFMKIQKCKPILFTRPTKIILIKLFS